MENELKIFKKKIAARYANREVLNWKFPYVESIDETEQSS